jgi:hypothetical protein
MNSTPSSTNLTWGLALCGFLALTDLAGLAGAGVDDAPPLALVLASAGCGVITLAALRPALRRVPAALWTVVVTRVLSALAGVPAFFVDAPAYARLAVGASLVVTALGVVLVLSATRRAGAATVRPA